MGNMRVWHFWTASSQAMGTFISTLSQKKGEKNEIKK